MARVLFVDSYPASLYGQQQTLLGLLERCSGAGIDPTVAAPGEGAFPEEARRRGHRVAVLEQPEETGRYGGAVYRDGPVRRLRTAAAVLGYVRRLRRWLRAERFDALFCNDLRGLLTFGLAARLSGAPVLIWDKLDQPHGLLDHLQLPLANRNLVIARSVLAKYPGWQRRAFAGRIRLAPCGVETAEFLKAGGKVPARTDGAVRLGIAGSINRRKGHDLLIPAFRLAKAEAPALELAIIGDAVGAADAAYRDRLMAETAGEAGIAWLGRRDDMPAVMASLDILAAPSRREGLPRVAIEAMAAGKPVIGAAGTGLEDVIVEEETGFLVDPADASALAERILRLARDPSLRARMGAAGRRRVIEEFDLDAQMGVVIDELLALAR